MLRRIRAIAVLTASLATAALITSGQAQAGTSIGAPVSPAASALAVTHALPVADSGEPVIGVVYTDVRWTRASTWLTYGGRAVLEGQVVTFDGALPDAAVTLFARPSGGDWRPVAGTRTDADTGLFVFRPKPARKTAYRVEYAGDLAYASSANGWTVNVKRKITSELAGNGDGTFTMRGTIAPRSAGKTVRLQRKACGSCSWSAIATTTAAGDSTFKFRVPGPGKPATWRFRAYVPGDTGFLTSVGDTWSVRRS